MKKMEAKKWYIIDPNPHNIFNSPALDFAKILQSLAIDYEFRNRNMDAEIRDNSIAIFTYSTMKYCLLLEYFEQKLLENYSAAFLDEVRLHTLVHILRLIPYQYKRSHHSGIGFTVLMLHYFEKYQHDWIKT